MNENNNNIIIELNNKYNILNNSIFKLRITNSTKFFNLSKKKISKLKIIFENEINKIVLFNHEIKESNTKLKNMKLYLNETNEKMANILLGFQIIGSDMKLINNNIKELNKKIVNL